MNLFHIKFRLAEHGFTFRFHVAIRGQRISVRCLHAYLGRMAIPGPRSRTAFRDAWHVFLLDLHLRKQRPPQQKYNAAQQIAYTAIVLMGFGSLVTGLAIYKPTQVGWLTFVCGGYAAARLIHFMLTLGYVAFFLVHIQQVVLAGWNNFRSMVIGYELVTENE